jgi:hypothetical protein
MSERTALLEQGACTAMSEARPPRAHDPREAMAADVAHCRQSIEHLKTLASSAAPAQVILLDTASDISVAPGITLHTTRRAPRDNSARFAWHSHTGGSEHVRFSFLWQNTSDRSVVLERAIGYLLSYGTCVAIADGGFILDPGDDRWSLVYVYGRIDINVVPTLPRQPDQVLGALLLHAQVDTPHIGHADTDRQDLDRALIVRYDQYVLPPQGTARIYLTFGLSASVRKGHAIFNFSPTVPRPHHEVVAYAVMLIVQP